MSERLAFSFLVLALFLCGSCHGPEGPAGPPGSEGLTDPSVQPRVIWTFPENGSEGPYQGNGYLSSVIIRFNKIMDAQSVTAALSIRSAGSVSGVSVSSVSTHDGTTFVISIGASQTRYGSYLWKVGETYSVRVDSTARDINSNALQPSFTLTFKPEPYFRIRRTYPADGDTNVGVYQSYFIEFNSLVTSSVFSAFQLSPLPEGEWCVYYYDSSQVSFSLTNQLAAGTTYLLQIDTTARDRFGNRLRESLASSYTTEAFRVSWTWPSAGGLVTYLNSYIAIYFSGGIDTGTVRAAFNLTPPTQGYFEWYYRSSYFRFIPATELLPRASYTATVSTAMRSSGGSALRSPYSFTFTTSPFMVIETGPRDGQINVYRDVHVYVLCNTYVDTSTIRQAFSISPNVGGTFSCYYPSDHFYFVPDSLLSANSTYTVTVSTALRTRGGSNLESPYTFSFSTGEN